MLYSLDNSANKAIVGYIWGIVNGFIVSLVAIRIDSVLHVPIETLLCKLRGQVLQVRPYRISLYRSLHSGLMQLEPQCLSENMFPYPFAVYLVTFP